MAYGTRCKELAEQKAAELARQYPTNRYEVQPHEVSPKGFAVTWGVMQFSPYCAQMPWRCNGFLWIFDVIADREESEPRPGSRDRDRDEWKHEAAAWQRLK